MPTASGLSTLRANVYSSAAAALEPVVSVILTRLVVALVDHDVTESSDVTDEPVTSSPVGAVHVSPIIGLSLQNCTTIPFTVPAVAFLKETVYVLLSSAANEFDSVILYLANIT